MSLSNIALLSYHTCPLASQEGKETGGMNIYVLELAKELVKQGVTIDIFTRSSDVSNPFIVEVVDGVRVIHLPAGPQADIPKKEMLRFVDDFVEQFFLFAQREHASYDVLYCHYYMSGLAGLKIQEKLHLPIVFTFHTLALMKNLVARTDKELEKPERITLEFELAKKVDTIIAASQSDAEYLHYLYEVPVEKVKVIPPGVNLQVFQPMSKEAAKQHIGADPDHKLVVFVGRVEPLKGIDNLIYALKILRTSNPEQKICLWIVGGDVSQPQSEWSTELQKLEELRQVLNMPTAVNFAGRKSQEELKYFYNAAELVVMPSHYESFGMAAAEAMACGTPVIMTNVTGISRFIDEKHRSLLTTVNNPLLLATQIYHVLSENELHRDHARELMTAVQDLGWSKIAIQVKKVLEDVVKG